MRRTTLILGALAALVAAMVTPAAASTAPTDVYGQAVSAVKTHAAQAHYAPGQTFTLRGLVTDPDGTRHIRLHRYVGGLPVLGGDLIVHLDRAGAWRGVSQTLRGAPRIATTPTLSAAQAAKAALAASSALDTSADGVQLALDTVGNAPARLAYEVVVSGIYPDGTPSELHVVVDAHNGQTIRSWDENMPGTGHGLHVGDVTIGTTAIPTGYELRDVPRGNHYTIDLQNRQSEKPGTQPISSSTDEFGDGTLSNRATVGVDAHFGAAATWDYYKNVHGRSGPRNDGVSPYSRVHYGRNYVNAFWSDSCFCMTYGDGDLSKGWYPLTSLDVAGHEMTHGLTSNTADLTYSGESGGLNEATSDIFGTLVEFHAAVTVDNPDYLIGEKLRTSGVPLRYMDKPSKDGKSVDCWYSGVGNLDVHYSSGVGNHFFFLLAVGSGARTVNGVAYDSPTCNGSSVTGIGNAKAGAIWYRALTVYMTSSTTYHGARTASLSAAADLYGSGSAEYATVAGAWAAVNVT